MKNETSKNEQKILAQLLPKGSNAHTQKELTAQDNARRLSALSPYRQAIKNAAIKAGREFYHAGCGEIKRTPIDWSYLDDPNCNPDL